MSEDEDYYIARAGGLERFNQLQRDEAERKFRGYLWHCQQRGEIEQGTPEAFAARMLGKEVKRDLSDVTLSDFEVLKRALNHVRKWNDE